jgi:hypothetical protein
MVGDKLLYKPTNEIPMPAAPKIPDWFSYIRPHIRPYDALGRGERRDYIAKLSKATKLSDNSLRRMIFAAEFLEKEGIKGLPAGGKLLVGAVERIARIAAREPEKRQQLLADAVAGKVTIQQLKDQLKKSDRVAKRARKDRNDFPLVELAKAALASQGMTDAKNMKDVDILHTEHAEHFNRGTRPSHALILTQGRRAVLLDGTSFAGTIGSFMRQRQEFFQNVLIAPSLYDFVVVYAPFWHAEAELLISIMTADVRSRVILMERETLPEKMRRLRQAASLTKPVSGSGPKPREDG